MDPRQRQGITLGLASDDDELRRLAVEQVASLPADEALPILLGCLGDASWRVRYAAVDRLVAAPDAWRAVASLVGALADDVNAGLRNAAVETLVRIGRRAVPALVDATGHGDADVRRLAVEALSTIGHESAVSCLSVCTTDRDPNVRSAAADGLGLLGGRDAEARLEALAVAPGEDRIVRFAALRALARLGAVVEPKRLEPALQDDRLRPMALAVLGHAEDEAALEALLDGVSSALRSTREAALEALLQWIARLDEEERASLVAELRRRAESGPALADALLRVSTADLPRRLALAQFLGHAGDANAVAPLLAAARDEAVRDVALDALARLDEVTECTLVALWSELDVLGRALACDALARTRGTAGARLLDAALGERQAEVRSRAAFALGQRRAVDSLPELVARLVEAARSENEEDGEASAMAAAVEQLARPRDASGTASAARVCSLFDQPLACESESVRHALTEVLAQIARPESGSRLVARLDDASARVRRAAIEGLALLGRSEDVVALRRALADDAPLVRIAGSAAIARCGPPECIEDLIRVASDPDPWVRAAALRAAGALAARHACDETIVGSELATPLPARVRAGAMVSAGLATPLPARVRALLRAGLGGEAPVALAAAETLRELGGIESARVAREALGRDEPEIAQAGVRCIGEHGDLDTVESLLALVAHEHWVVRAEAVDVLGERHVLRAAPAILQRLEAEQDEFVRAAMLRALDRLGV